ncbi:MAG TPA: Xaa-Pro peptidase family protein [Gaiellaceae bacterium]|nr:Xaa-Pro peptidase family protein [Gaiellaceae bacterium]
MNDRIERLRGELDALGAATFLVTNLVNVRYLTGFASSNAAALVGRERVLLATDGRYAEAAGEVEGVEALTAERDLLAWLGTRLAELVDGPVAFEADTVTVAGLQALEASGLELVPAAGVVLRLRAVKEEAELEAIRRAARVTVNAFELLAQESLVGRTEAEVAWWMERTLRDEGAEAVAFPVIVGGGPNSALPHHHPGPRTIGPGETVIVDAGARVDGYCADCTRTFATGELPGELQEAYALCHAAQADALAAVRPGASAVELDAIARERIESSGTAPVLHGLGHGVGLEVHELPVLRPTSPDVLVAGHVVTVEPGVYLAGTGGVRIEDLVVVGEEGPEVLTAFTKDLLTLD